MENIHKIGIGTVQFGSNYGISNKNGQTSEKEIEKILKTAFENGIEIIDTAAAYGNAELLLGKHDLTEFRVVSKFLVSSENKSIGSLLDQSLRNLNLENIYGYLAHRPMSLIENQEYWADLKKLKAVGLIQKIGYSLNESKELDLLLEKNYIPDLVQMPFNYFDRRFESRIKDLKKLGCEIHTRSTFLQGLFFTNPFELGSFFDKIKPHLYILQKQHESLSSDLLDFVLKNDYIDKVIIGVENNKQLLENLRSSKSVKPLEDLEFNLSDEILMPMYWPK